MVLTIVISAIYYSASILRDLHKKNDLLNEKDHIDD